MNPKAQARARREILQSSESIPPLPDLVVRLLQALNRPETEPEDLEALMQADPVLVVRMLAMVNSPFFGINRTISTVREAVMVLGFRGIRTLALATSTSRFLSRDFSCYGYRENGLWHHSMAVATIARHLAKGCGLSANQSEEIFVAGLLHDVGKMLLAHYLTDAELIVGVHGSTLEVETRASGLTHDEAGALVAAKWNLSLTLQELIANHHDPDAEPSDALSILRVADAIAHRLGVGWKPGVARTEGPTAVDLDRLPFDADGLAELTTTASELIEQALRSLPCDGAQRSPSQQ